MSRNRWIYSTTYEQDVLTNCKPLANEISKINNTSVLHLPQNCDARIGDIHLTTNKMAKTTFETLPSKVLTSTYLTY